MYADLALKNIAIKTFSVKKRWRPGRRAQRALTL